MKTLNRRAFCVATASALAAPALRAEGYPDRPVSVLCAFPAGASADAALRGLAHGAGKLLGQQVIVENKPGVAGTLAAGTLMGAKPDGYTLAQVTNTLVRQPFLGHTPYDISKDFSYILGVTAFEVGLVVRADAPWKSLADLVADARKRPDTLSYGTSGTGTVQHQVMVRIAEKERLQWTHVPFKGQSPAMTDLQGGHIQMLSDTTAWAPFVDAGKFRLLAVYGPQRLKRWPAAPTLRELGYDIAESIPWGLVGPTGMDRALVAKLDGAFHKAMDDPAFTSALDMLGQEPRYMSSENYARYMHDRIAIERDVVDRYNLKSQ